MKYAVKKKELLYNPAECVSLPKNMEREISRIRYFTDEQITKMISESIRCYKTGNRVYRLGEIILFLLNTGMRIGEALALKWTDIDFQKQNVKVRKNVVFVKNRDNEKSKNYEYKEQSTKTKSGSRIVPLNSDAMKALISIKGINGKYEYVFSTSKGNRLYPRNVDRMFRSILKNCDIELTGVHTLRHTFASRLFAKGIHPEFIDGEITEESLTSLELRDMFISGAWICGFDSIEEAYKCGAFNRESFDGTPDKYFGDAADTENKVVKISLS